MRRVLGMLAAIGLVSALLPATVAAGQPIRDSMSQSNLLCELSTESGYASLYAEPVGDGSYTSLILWEPGSDPLEDLPDIVSQEWTSTFDGSRLSAQLALYSIEWPTNPDDPPILQPAGSAALAAELVPVGDPQPFDSRELRDGNVWIRIGQSFQLFAVDGLLTIDLIDGPDDEVELTGCGASTFTQTLFQTNPNAYVLGGDQLFMSCAWQSDLGTVELRAVNDDFGTTFSQLIITQAERGFAALAVPDFSDAAYASTAELFDRADRSVVGSVTAEASFSPTGDRINDREWVEGTRFSLVGERLAVDGSLTVTLEGTTMVLEMDDTACEATDLRVKVIQKVSG